MTTSWLRLPLEVRNQIYEDLFRGAVIKECGGAVGTENYHLGITATNKQTRVESLPVLYSSTILHFRGPRGKASALPEHVRQEARVIRLHAHRLRTLNTLAFAKLEIMLLDVHLEPAVWRIYQAHRENPSNAHADVSDMVNLGMALGVFEHSWDVDKVWRDSARSFKVWCWFSSWTEEDVRKQPILVDIDTGMVLQEPERGKPKNYLALARRHEAKLAPRHHQHQQVITQHST